MEFIYRVYFLWLVSGYGVHGLNRLHLNNKALALLWITSIGIIWIATLVALYKRYSEVRKYEMMLEYIFLNQITEIREGLPRVNLLA
jgi:hypothetical protein